jgi:hypothetical protein
LGHRIPESVGIRRDLLVRLPIRQAPHSGVLTWCGNGSADRAQMIVLNKPKYFGYLQASFALAIRPSGTPIAVAASMIALA